MPEKAPGRHCWGICRSALDLWRLAGALPDARRSPCLVAGPTVPGSGGVVMLPLDRCAALLGLMRSPFPRLSIRSFGRACAPGGFILWDGTDGLGRREPGCDVWWGIFVRLCAGDLAVTPGWGEVRRFDLVIGLAVLCRPGGDLLSRVLRRSTIGAEGFNGRVRNGIGFRPLARTTRPAEHSKVKHWIFRWCVMPLGAWALSNESDQADRVISTGKLHALLRFHTRPINVVVYHDSQGRPRFKVGFPLRCLQRLARPYVATLLCGWRHNRSTRGTSIPVLSY